MRTLSILSVLFSLTIFTSCTKQNIEFNQDVQYGFLVDSRDQQEYKTIEIGNQIWMAENLRYSRYPQNEITYCNYGRMYSANYEICPENWHLPDSTEWEILIAYLGGKDIAGGKMKEAGNKHWDDPNKDATNSSGFTALPAGSSDYYNGLSGRNYSAQFWTSTKNEYPDIWTPTSHYYVSLGYKSGKISFSYSTGYDDYSEQRTVRCIKDNQH
jgi:uncharacterized protein (TIGR02145 family)